MYRIHKEHIIYAMSSENKPCMEVEIGSRLIFETYDCFENQIDSEDVAFQELDGTELIRRLDLYISVMQSLVTYYP